MAQYAIAFDLNTRLMDNDNLSQTEKTKIYQTDIPRALSSCGFTMHPQGSLYHTDCGENALPSIMQLQSALTTQAPRFCKYVRRVHVFRMEEWSDVTHLLSDNPSAAAPSGDEELAEQEYIDAALRQLQPHMDSQYLQTAL